MSDNTVRSQMATLSLNTDGKIIPSDMTSTEMDVDTPVAGSAARESDSWWGPDVRWLIEDEPDDSQMPSDLAACRYHFLHRVGDYAGRLWNLIREAARHEGDTIGYRVGPFRDQLTAELDNSPANERPGIDALERAVGYLAEENFDVDLEMVKLAILVYGKRNAICHAKVGALPSGRMNEEIDRDIASLPLILPDSHVQHYHETWRRIMRFYSASQGWQPPRRSERIRNRKSSQPHQEPDLRTRTTPERQQAFSAGAFETRLRTISRTPEVRKPHTPYRRRTRSSVSDLTSYLDRKRCASGSPDPDGGSSGIDNRTASDQEPSAIAFGNEEDAQLFTKFQESLGALYDKRAGVGRRVLEGALGEVNAQLKKLEGQEQREARKKARRK